MTNTSAGITPLKNARMPPSLKRSVIVPIVVGAFCGCVGPDGSWSVGSPLDVVAIVGVGVRLRAVMRVLTTQIGLVIRTVAEPARAPAAMDSRVVSLERERPDLVAAFSKAARDHSYPRQAG